jgi:ABC-2 type transport system permease protein
MLANVFTKTLLDRWKGMTIGVVTLAALFVMGMAVYRDIDLSLYTSLPEVYRSLFNIPSDADIGALAYGAIYGSYGALIIASLALTVGSGAIAGEERNGTFGLLLTNPKSRTSVLVSKGLAMLVLVAAASLALWSVGLVVPLILHVDITGMHVGALVFHLGMVSMFVGLLALAIGASTGKPGLAAGVSAGVMIVSFVAVGLLPLIKGWEDLARAFPWYYFTGSDPVNNGTDWAHIGILLAGCVALSAVAVVGLNRRDLRSQSAGVSIIDRLRANPVTNKVADRLAGSARVSRIWARTFSENQALIYITSALMFLMMGLMIGPMYTLLDTSLLDLASQIPDTMIALFGGGDMSTPEGFYQIESFGMMAPVAVMAVTMVMGARSLAGEEARRTMGLLLANPVSRMGVLMQKTAAMIVGAIVVGLSTFAGVAGGSLLGGLGMSIGNIAATSLLVTLVGLVFGSLALAISAATGRVKTATYGSLVIAVILFLWNAFIPLDEKIAGWAGWSPFYYYLSSDPLNNGMNWSHAAILTALVVLLVGVAVPLFNRRDLRQTG